MSKPILVIEDHPLFATGIKELVEFVANNAEIRCASTLRQALNLCSDCEPALIITDLRLPDAIGQSVIDQVSGTWPSAPLVVMSGDTQLMSGLQLSQHSAHWCLSKAEGFEQTSAIVLEALSRAGISVQWRPNNLSARHQSTDHVAGRSGMSNGIQLTHKQQQVMQFLASGMSNKEIARKLELSPETIKTHLREIFTRMNVKNRTQAVSLYRKIPRLTSPTAQANFS